MIINHPSLGIVLFFLLPIFLLISITSVDARALELPKFPSSFRVTRTFDGHQLPPMKQIDLGQLEGKKTLIGITTHRKILLHVYAGSANNNDIITRYSTLTTKSIKGLQQVELSDRGMIWAIIDNNAYLWKNGKWLKKYRNVTQLSVCKHVYYTNGHGAYLNGKGFSVPANFHEFPFMISASDNQVWCLLDRKEGYVWKKRRFYWSKQDKHVRLSRIFVGKGNQVVGIGHASRKAVKLAKGTWHFISTCSIKDIVVDEKGSIFILSNKGQLYEYLVK
ncbi:hypothetical protein KAJ27_15205 [bacterium]|nr:hypothetical protein [bacterium]